MKADATSQTSHTTSRFRSLRSKAFVPFLLLIIALGISATWGAFHLADQSFKSSADERLTATSEVLYREFKKQEVILETYAVIMQQFQSLSERFHNEPEIGILQDRLFNTLEKSNISTFFYPPDIRGIIQNENLITLFDQVRRSNKPRFRYTSDFGTAPVLMVAAPIFRKNELSQVLLLHTVMGDTFLRNTTSALNVSAALMDSTGKVVAKSSPDFTPIKISPAQADLVSSGQQLFLDHETNRAPERHLFSLIPLGSTDTVLLSLEASLDDTTESHNQSILRMILIMSTIIVIGTIFYLRIISRVTHPARELLRATEAISSGNLGYRIMDITNDELGQIATSFNDMAVELENSYQIRAKQDIATALAREEEHLMLVLEKKEREREKISEELDIMQRESSALYQLNQAMTASIDLGVLFDRILLVLTETLACDHIVFLIHNTGESVLEVVRASGLDSELLSKVSFKFNQGITGEAAQSQRTIYVKDMVKEERNLSYHGLIASHGSMLSIPLVVKGRLIGIINLHKKQQEAFSASEQKLAQAIANQTAIAIDNAQLLEKSRDLSNTDDMTGLANRRYFQDILKREVAQARRFSSTFSILMCDIDGFNQHKTNLGDIQSNALIRQVAQTLLKSTRGIDVVSRFGHDQFIILLPKTSKEGAFAAAEKLRHHVLDENFANQIYCDQPLDVTVSFGVAEFPTDSKNMYELMNLADRALYAAKQDGSNCSVAWEGSSLGLE